jgi:hypothetical protein
MKIKLKFLLFLSLLALLLFSCRVLPPNQVDSPNPKIISTRKAQKLANTAPHSGFSYTGLSFFNGRLYASSSIGLLEYENGKLSHLYRWQDRKYDWTDKPFEAVGDIAFDKSHQSLWFFHHKIGKFIRFDGENWHFVDLPQIVNGYSRGDMLKGFNVFSTDSAFWFNIVGEAWRWNADKNSWNLQVTSVEKNCFVTTDTTIDTRCIAGIVPLQDKVLSIMHRQYMSEFGNPTTGKQKLLPDRVYYEKNGNWQEVLPKDSANDFVTKEVIAGKNAAFVKTWYGTLFRVTDAEITKIETLGEIEAMTTTTAGNLLVSFRNNGIYEYEDEWQKRFPSPYSTNEPEHFTHLAESNGQIAIAISSERDKNFKYLGQTTLWITDGNELRIAQLEE